MSHPDVEFSGVLSTAPSDVTSIDGCSVCRICWDCQDAKPGGRISRPCNCTTGVHDRCLMQWLLSESGRADLQACELCVARWEGHVTVSIGDLLEAVAAWKGSQPDSSDLAFALQQLRQRNEQLQQLLEQAADAEGERRREYGRMKRIAAADRQAILGRLEEERAWRRSNLRWLPQLLLITGAAFLAGWHRGGAARST